jgi:hypothetical protein
MVRLIMDRYSSVCGDFARGTYRVIEFEAAQDPIGVLEGSLRGQDVNRPELEVVHQRPRVPARFVLFLDTIPIRPLHGTHRLVLLRCCWFVCASL